MYFRFKIFNPIVPLLWSGGRKHKNIKIIACEKIYQGKIKYTNKKLKNVGKIILEIIQTMYNNYNLDNYKHEKNKKFKNS